MSDCEFRQRYPHLWNGHPIPYGAPVEELARLITEPPPACWTAFEALGSTPGDAALDLLRESACSLDPQVRYSAIEAIGNHPDGWRLGDIIDGLLSDSHGFVVRSACHAVAKHRLVDLHDVIFRLLDSRDVSTRRTAVCALKEIWHPGDFDRVFLVHRSDLSPEVRKEAGWTLVSTASLETWRPLFDIWQADPMPRYRQWACELAADFGDESTLSLVRSLTNDPDGHVRISAHRTLRELSGSRCGLDPGV